MKDRKGKQYKQCRLEFYFEKSIGGAGYKPHYICFVCRKSFKGIIICPNCKQEMVYAGYDFKAPRSSNKTQWRKVELIMKTRKHFNACTCCGKNHYIKTLGEAKNLS